MICRRKDVRITLGFSLHGCIYKISRKLSWLKVRSSNQNPEVIVHYFIDAISELGDVPHIIKADDGTEHALIEPIHIYLCSINEEEGIENVFGITTSPQNQRIEAYWSILRRDRLGLWKRPLHDLSDNDMLDTFDPEILDCVRFPFINLILHGLNRHIISYNFIEQSYNFKKQKLGTRWKANMYIYFTSIV